jgi:hypothetical protein
MLTYDNKLSSQRALHRSQRVCVGVEVVVLWQDPESKPGLEETRTLIVSSHGALISLQRMVKLNKKVTIVNAITREKVDCRVADLNCVDQSGMTGIAVEFVEPAPRFWRIAFPPVNWSPRSLEAKSYAPKMALRPKTRPVK